MSLVHRDVLLYIVSLVQPEMFCCTSCLWFSQRCFAVHRVFASAGCTACSSFVTFSPALVASRDPFTKTSSRIYYVMFKGHVLGPVT